MPGPSVLLSDLQALCQAPWHARGNPYYIGDICIFYSMVKLGSAVFRDPLMCAKRPKHSRFFEPKDTLWTSGLSAPFYCLPSIC
jgi:hypothetical protein